MPDSGRPRPLRVMARGWRGLCPACGKAPVYESGFRARQRCGVCDWRLERGPGHWLGGSEINMLATFPAATAFFVVLGSLFGFHLGTVLLGFAFAAVFSIAFLRRSRCLFYALDYVFDPHAEPAEDEGDEWLRKTLGGEAPPGGPGGAAKASSGRRAGPPTARPRPAPALSRR